MKEIASTDEDVFAYIRNRFAKIVYFTCNHMF